LDGFPPSPVGECRKRNPLAALSVGAIHGERKCGMKRKRVVGLVAALALAVAGTVPAVAAPGGGPGSNNGCAGHQPPPPPSGGCHR
jgi:hypothetical protein